MTDPTLAILMYFVVPIWLLAGIVDWFCHRRSNIAQTSGAKESLIHLLMFAEVGIPLILILICEVNSLIIAISIIMFLLHELTAMWDVSYAVTKRRVGPVEQHVHSFLEMIPLLALVLIIARHWPHFTSLFTPSGFPPDFTLRLKEAPLPTTYLSIVLFIAVVLEFAPYVEEFIRGMKARSNKPDHQSPTKSEINQDQVFANSEAKAASPLANSIAGEEDPGAALEMLVANQLDDKEKK
ncbi:hypothetical protein [Aliiglaciecola lipolytica]|uniref:Diguanylate cyclase/phosphodiesterase with PAS/PAC sensor n=1 Tax=Aliiglaciecola lipolytica E3 TaxID=1127673 RepID=K6YH51_9ALTE|nr:hypothetical protein [Aliiglaciecola lipolytica]GAC15943.1 diguanylate cyclase/phosphodiesterase with PAS/PAC sensor [Aliiglaciecola lipolytica E3]